MEETIREALIQFVNADFATAFPTYPLAVDNGPFDWNDLPPTFVTFNVEFMGGEQVGLARNPKRRERGFAYVTVYAREGLGWRALTQPKDWFANKLKFQYIGIATLEAPRPDGSHDGIKGYAAECIKVPFFTDPT